MFDKALRHVRLGSKGCGVTMYGVFTGFKPLNGPLLVESLVCGDGVPVSEWRTGGLSLSRVRAKALIHVVAREAVVELQLMTETAPKLRHPKIFSTPLAPRRLLFEGI